MALAALAQQTSEPIRLWPGDAPLAQGSAASDIPALTYFPADKDNKLRAALLIFPGGGYGGLADHEGSAFAQAFTQYGYDCFVLRYRLGSNGYRHPAMLMDAERAMRIVRSRAGEMGYRSDKIGVIGSSAGGHLAATLATKFTSGSGDDPIEKLSSRPDFAILCYPVITMGPQGHAGSRENLLGKNASPDLVDELSAEKHVRNDTPPCFIWHTVDDSVVPVENSLMFAQALSAKKIPYELHLYESGAHGLGLSDPAPPVPGRHATHPWVEAAIRWMTKRLAAAD